jgi:hypothetical protein
MYCPKNDCNSSDVYVNEGFFSNDCRCRSCGHKFQTQGTGTKILGFAATVLGIVAGGETLADHYNHNNNNDHRS